MPFRVIHEICVVTIPRSPSSGPTQMTISTLHDSVLCSRGDFSAVGLFRSHACSTITVAILVHNGGLPGLRPTGNALRILPPAVALFFPLVGSSSSSSSSCCSRYADGTSTHPYCCYCSVTQIIIRVCLFTLDLQAPWPGAALEVLNSSPS